MPEGGARRPSPDYLSAARWDTTIQRLFAESVAADPEALLVVDGEERLSRGGLADAARRIRVALTAVGVRPGDVVSMQLPNAWSTVAAMHGVWSAGAIVNPITTIYRGRELEVIFGSARPRVVLATAPTSASRSGGAHGVDFVAQAREAVRASGSAAVVLDLAAVLAGVPVGSAISPSEPAPAAADDLALLMFTSGTTGRPKGVLHSHRSLLYEAASIGEVFDLAGDTVFMPSPLAHVTGLLYGILTPLVTGGAVSLLDRWDPEVATDLIERDRCAFTVSATPFLRGLAESYARRGSASSLRGFVCGGADIPPSLVAEADRALGIRVARTYGSTEMPTLCIVRPDDDAPERYSSEGYPIGEAAARLSADGELEVRGPELFAGYLDPADDEEAFTADGWFRTGDLADLAADGRVTITGRRKDLIVRGGENISAKEVEDLLVTHPAVSDVAMIGVPDPRMGERACAMVVVAAGWEIDLTGLTAHLDRQSIARQKYPELLWKVEALPRTVSGKVQKFVLRRDVAAAVEAGLVEARG